jgi:hypothetical protein
LRIIPIAVSESMTFRSALAQVFSIVSCGARAAGPPPSQTEFVRLIDDVVCGLGESFLGVIGDDPTSKAARDAKIINRPILSASRLLPRDSSHE